MTASPTELAVNKSTILEQHILDGWFLHLGPPVASINKHQVPAAAFITAPTFCGMPR